MDPRKFGLIKDTLCNIFSLVHLLVFIYFFKFLKQDLDTNIYQFQSDKIPRSGHTTAPTRFIKLSNHMRLLVKISVSIK